MFDFLKARLGSVYCHEIGTKARFEHLTLSNKSISLSTGTSDLLFHYISIATKSAREHEFTHAVSIDLNPVHSIVDGFFSRKNLRKTSESLARLIYDLGTHPNIKTGTLVIADIFNVRFNGSNHNMLGIFKIESRENFLQFLAAEDSISLGQVTAFSPEQIDKACLIAYDEGLFRVFTSEPTSTDTKYWKREFLGVSPLVDARLHTENLTVACKYIAGSIAKKEGPKAKATFLGGVLSYLDDNSEFAYEDFRNQFFDSATSAEFEEFVTKQLGDPNVLQEFAISNESLKGFARPAERTVTLDTGVKIVFPPASEAYVERGYDETTKKSYYKIYFRSES